MSVAPEDAPSLLVFFAPADHPQRDAVCATLAWLADAEGSLFECYYDSTHSGIHVGGGHPGWYGLSDLRGGTVTGGRHVETFTMLTQRFRCRAACLGETMFDGILEAARVPIRSKAADIATFYREMFATSAVPWPSTLLIIGNPGRIPGLSLVPFAFPEVVGRRLLAIADGDPSGLEALAPGTSLEGLWLADSRVELLRQVGFAIKLIAGAPADLSFQAQTAWMAQRWQQRGQSFLLGDPELVGRWIPTAARRGWLPLYGLPQSGAIAQMQQAISRVPVVYGRQQRDQDFFQLSRLGTAFQVIDPGRPPFPVIREVADRWPAPTGAGPEPSDEQLSDWAAEGRVLTTLLFWTGMIRELENLYPLADVLSLTGLCAGLVVTSETFAYMRQPPLSLVQVPYEAGGLFPRVELLLADAGIGVMIAADAPTARFSATLRQSIAELGVLLGDPLLLPRGWWGTMDARLLPGRPPILGTHSGWPQLRLRYRAPELDLSEDARSTGPPTVRKRIVTVARRLGLRQFFEPLRPYESYRPGPPGRTVLEAVRDAGFEYAFTKSAFGPPSKVVSGIDGLTVLNYTAGRWDGWTPFVTINSLADLRRAERQLIRSHRPGWLIGTFDSCLWAFTGTVWERGTELQAICRWTAEGGSSGRLLNVTPRAVARYARLLAGAGRVGQIDAE